MQNYKIILQYDGTNYNGWQKQGNTSNTIQGKLEKVISLVTDEKVEVNGAGRTDAGVHAMGQVANFKLETVKDAAKLKKLINHNLPDDICITDMQMVDDRFHSRLNCKGKTYIYRMQNTFESDVFTKNFKYHYDAELNIEMMKKAAEMLKGSHDFKSFCSNKHMKKSTIRCIEDIKIKRDAESGELDITFLGDGFLYNMVRIITGTLIEVGRGLKTPDDINNILEARDRSLAGPTAPACGLILWEVRY